MKKAIVVLLIALCATLAFYREGDPKDGAAQFHRDLSKYLVSAGKLNSLVAQGVELDVYLNQSEDARRKYMTVMGHWPAGFSTRAKNLFLESQKRHLFAGGLWQIKNSGVIPPMEPDVNGWELYTSEGEALFIIERYPESGEYAGRRYLPLAINIQSLLASAGASHQMAVELLADDLK